MARNADSDFKWTDLKGKRVLAGRPGGVPAMTLQYVLENAGVELGELDFDTDVAFDLMNSVFETDKTVDYTTMFEPTASQFEADGKGYVVASVGEAAGEVAYTAFSASKSYMEKHPDNIEKFLEAIVEGYKFIVEHTFEEVAEAISPSFVGISKEMLTKSIERYFSIDAWCHTPVLTEEAFNRLEDIMANAGTLSSRADYSKAVDNSFALKIIG